MLERISGVPVWSYFALSLIASAFLSTVFYGDIPEKGLMGVIAISCGVFAVVAWCAVIPLMKFNIKQQWEVNNKMIESIRWKLLSQEVVDARLQQMATTLEALRHEQVQLTGEDAEGLLEQKLAHIKEFASAFVIAQQLARKLGFTVRDAPQYYVQR